ncbi:MAG: flap endonuclease [bacterium]|nr:flap endonuclease [bacterium]
MNVHLIDGTYELFRHFYALPSRLDTEGKEVGALVGVVRSVASMIRGGATHLGVATDHTVESFRNEMYKGYKTGEGIDPDLWGQFHPLEDALRAIGVVVWPMVDQEADDALAAAAIKAGADTTVERVFICTPDKDLAQCVRGDSIVQLDRRRGITRNESGVQEKFGVLPGSIPDYLGLVGDAADGFPGIPKWGAKSASTVLAQYGKLEKIPKDEADWTVRLRGAAGLAVSLRNNWLDALLFRDIATLRTDADVFSNVDELRWRGPADDLPRVCERLGVPELVDEVARLLQ